MAEDDTSWQGPIDVETLRRKFLQNEEVKTVGEARAALKLVGYSLILEGDGSTEPYTDEGDIPLLEDQRFILQHSPQVKHHPTASLD